MSDPLVEAKQFRRHHSIQLPDGRVIPGSKSLKLLQREAQIIFRYGVEGKTVIDIGAWDGYFSFDAERRGASRVLAADKLMWGGSERVGFDIARDALKSKVEKAVVSVEDLSPETVGTFDVSLFLGVLYHMRDPMGALERVASITNEMIIVETLVALGHGKESLAMFFPFDEMNGDSSNWWAPTPHCAMWMLRSAGFKRVVFAPGPVMTKARRLRSALRGSLLGQTTYSRGILFGWKS